MKGDVLVTVSHFAAGIIAGIAYGITNIAPIPLLVLGIAAKGSEAMSKEKKGIKWWFSNGFPIFLLSFIVAWTFAFNMV